METPGPVGAAASSAAQPVILDASKLHVPQTVVLQHQVVRALEEVAVTWDEGERRGCEHPQAFWPWKVPGSFESPCALRKKLLTRRGPSEAGKGTWLWE